jgi:hypothetical protein
VLACQSFERWALHASLMHKHLLRVSFY